MSDLTPIIISLKTATLATIITFFLGIITARSLLTSRGVVKGLLDGLLTIPLVLPPTVVGFLLLLLLGRNGPGGKLLQLFEVRVIFTWAATVIAATVVAFPLMYKTALGAFKQIDSNLLAAARTLGASEGKVFWWVMLPLARPGLIAGTLLTFARALGEFGATIMVAGSIPGQTQTIPVAIFFAAESGAMDQALVWVLITVAISLVVTMGVNFWSDAAIHRNKQQKSHIELAIQSPLPSAQTQSKLVELSVEIHKQLADFSLDVSFTANQQPLGLLGASGAGKSLILRCIAGLETPDSGRIILNGKVLFDSQKGINLPSRDRKVGFLFQNYALFPHLTVAQNIAFGIPKGKSKLGIKQQVEAQLVAVQLGGMGNRYPHQLSGGQQQRVALARALASQPEVLLLDEPFSACDTYLRHQLEKFLLTNLTSYQGATLFVTHNLEEAYRVCSDLLIVEAGKIAARGSKQDIFEHPPGKNVAAVTGCKNFSHGVAINSQEVMATDWQCVLKVVEPIPANFDYIGIRAHQLIFSQDTDLENTFPCWLTATSETQHRMTLYLKLNNPPQSSQDYHLQAEVFKEKWTTLKDMPYPWHVQLHPLRLILMPGDREIGGLQG